MCLSLHILSLSLLLLWLHTCHLLICGHSTLWPRSTLLIHLQCLELLMDLLGQYQRFMPPTHLSDPWTPQLLACKRPKEPAWRAPVSPFCHEDDASFSKLLCTFRHRWNEVSDSFCSNSTPHRLWIKAAADIGINAKIGIGKFIPLPFFCPSLKREKGETSDCSSELRHYLVHN